MYIYMPFPILTFGFPPAPLLAAKTALNIFKWAVIITETAVLHIRALLGFAFALCEVGKFFPKCFFSLHFFLSSVQTEAKSLALQTYEDLINDISL